MEESLVRRALIDAVKHCKDDITIHALSHNVSDEILIAATIEARKRHDPSFMLILLSQIRDVDAAIMQLLDPSIVKLLIDKASPAALSRLMAIAVDRQCTELIMFLRDRGIDLNIATIYAAQSCKATTVKYFMWNTYVSAEQTIAMLAHILRRFQQTDELFKFLSEATMEVFLRLHMSSVTQYAFDNMDPQSAKIVCINIANVSVRSFTQLAKDLSRTRRELAQTQSRFRGSIKREYDAVSSNNKPRLQ